MELGGKGFVINRDTLTSFQLVLFGECPYPIVGGPLPPFLYWQVKTLKATIDILGDKVSDLEKDIAEIKSESRRFGTGQCFEISKEVKVLLKKAIIAKRKTSGKKVLNCEFCDYTCMKSITLKKHMGNNHKNSEGDDDNGCPSED